MRPAPKDGSSNEGIDRLALPPGPLVTPPVQFPMVQPADWNSKAVADFSSHRPLLGKLDVMRIRWGSATHETGLRGHKLQVFAVALTDRLADDGDGLLARLRLR